MSRESNKQVTKISEKDIVGLKYFDKLGTMLQRLHDVGCERDSARNRTLHFDQYCMLVLLFLFNPIVTSMRALQQASELKKVQKKLGCKRSSLGSLSESVAVFDPERLKEIIAELGTQIETLSRDSRLTNIAGALTAVDSTLINALPRMTQASLLKNKTGNAQVKWRLHTHFEVDRHVPTRIEVTQAAGGDCDERAVMKRTIESDRLYVMDRGYAKFTLFNKIVAANSSYVCRIRDNSAYEVTKEHSLSEADTAQRVVEDVEVNIGMNGRKDSRPDHTIRIVTIAMKPHRSVGHYGRPGTTGPACDGFLRLATNLLDVPAEIIALIYHYRWMIEIFFRFLKQILGCRHLLSHSQNGIEIQTYCAIIACMLISLWTGKKPTLRTYEMICYYFTGLADEEELLAHISKLKSSDD